MALREWYTRALFERLPRLVLGLGVMHVLQVGFLLGFTPADDVERRWADGIILAHTAQLGLAIGFGLWARYGWRAGAHLERARWVGWAFGLSYLLFGATASGIDQLRDLGLVAHGTAVFAVAAILETRALEGALLFGLSAAALVVAVALGQDEASSRVSLQVNGLGLSAVGFAVSQLMSQWRFYGWWRQQVAERAAAELTVLNERLAAEIERRRAIEAELEALAGRDPLTELDNRRGFLGALERAKASGRGAVLLLDVDHFKDLNDAHGHPAGDAALRRIARVLREGVRSDDTVARLGGDEFGVVLPGATLEEAEGLAHALRTAIRDARPGPEAQRLSVSLGVAELGRGDAGERVVERADAALYRAKAAGRDRVSR